MKKLNNVENLMFIQM